MTTQTRTSTLASTRGFCLNRLLSAAAAITLTMVALAAVQPAQASETTFSTIAVTYADLDLGTEAGARTLYRRLKMAASHVCGSVDHRDLSRDRIWQQCHDQALDDAVAHVGAPTLLALHHKSVTHTVRHG